MLSSGSRDRLILQRDVRTPSIAPERRLVGHRQEVCGLKWSPDNQYLASGGNDNKLFVWSGRSTNKIIKTKITIVQLGKTCLLLQIVYITHKDLL